MPEQGGPATVGAFIGARIYRDGDGRLTTDSSTLYEVAALAGSFASFVIHAFVVEGTARDEVLLPPGTRVRSLGTVTDGRSLYLSAPSIAARTIRSCRTQGWQASVIFETGLLSLLALAACAATGIPTVAAIRGDSARTAGTGARHRAGTGRMVGWGLRALHASSQRAIARSVPVVVDSHAVGRRIEARGGEAVVVPAGSIPEAAILRRRDFWRPESGRPLRALYVGRFEVVKGVDDVIRAIGAARAAGVPVHLDLVGAGDPDHEVELRRLVAELRLDDSVRFLGPIAHGPLLFERYAGSDLLVLASRSEGTPKVVAEAFAHGLPVVATRVGGLAHVVADGHGRLVPPGSPGALAKAIASYHEEPDRLREDGLRCLLRSRSLTIEATTRALADAVGRARPPRWIGRPGR